MSEPLHIINRIEDVVDDLDIRIVRNWQYTPGQTEPLTLPMFIDLDKMHLRVEDIDTSSNYEFSLQLIASTGEKGEKVHFNADTIQQVQECIKEFLTNKENKPLANSK